MAKPLSIIVTGANRGIGRAICEGLLKRPDASQITLYACSRKGEDLGFHSNDNQNAIRKVLYGSLDIADAQSVDNFIARHINQNDNKEQIDVLINNAGVNLDNKPSLDNAKRTLDVNYYGTIRMCQSILPYMPAGGRIVNVSSIASALRLYTEPIRERFRQSRTFEDLDKIIHDYLTCIKDGTEEQSGFGTPGRTYNVSKALINAATKIFAEEHKSILINCCCPGWVATDMGAMVGKPSKTPEQGATIPLRLALDDIDNTSGQYWANSTISSTENGSVKRW